MANDWVRLYTAPVHHATIKGESSMLEMNKEQSIVVEDHVVCCNGGGGVLGHPAVFLSLEKTGDVVCPYCSKHFVWKDLN